MPNKHKPTVTSLFFLLLAISLIIFGLDKLSYLDWLKRPIESLVNPLRSQYYIFKKSINNQLSASWRTINNPQDLLILRQKAEHYERENADLQQKLAEMQKENDSMRKLLGAPLPANWQFIPAKVLNISQGLMTIDRGSDNGVKVGQSVVFENFLVGRILSVTPRQAIIMLVEHKDTKIKVKVISTKAKGLVRSDAGKIILDEVLQSYSLAKDQVVVTSGEDNLYPPNLIIGKIDSVMKNETAVYQQAVLSQLIVATDLDTVFVVRD